MDKRGVIVSSIFLLAIMLLATPVYAEENESENVLAEDPDAELEADAGIGPDSAFYFVDEFFDRFSDDVTVRQEKIAEIKQMIEEGNYEAARKALKRYRQYADNLEREVSPEQREEARRSAAAIYNVLKELEDQIPEEDRDEFVNDIIDREGRIVTAAEIAEKIKELCEELSELDPLQYSRVCNVGEDSPDWQRDLHKDLTEEQREEAEEFFDIMMQCFETSGETCRCEDISIAPFAERCSQIAPLAYACDIEGDEAACDKMDRIDDEDPIEDLLPDYLKEVLKKVEKKFEKGKFDHHAPRECREAGATTREECHEIMFKLDAPQECIDAWERGDLDISSEREAREGCERIMFDLEGPQECKDAGITDFRECGEYMFSQYAPQECIDAGLTGSNRGDEKKCREITGDFHDGPHHGPGPGGHIDFSCANVQDPMERLECFDRAANQVDSHHGGFDDPNYDGPCMTHEDWEDKKRECQDKFGRHAGDEPIYGDSGEGYECVIDATCIDFGDYTQEDYSEDGEWHGGPVCDDCVSQCGERSGQRLRGTGCGPNGCECYYESEHEHYDHHDDGGGYDSGSDGTGETSEPTPQEATDNNEASSSGGSANEGTTDSGSAGGESDSGGDTASDSGGDSGGDNTDAATGAAISKLYNYQF